MTKAGEEGVGCVSRSESVCGGGGNWPSKMGIRQKITINSLSLLYTVFTVVISNERIILSNFKF